MKDNDSLFFEVTLKNYFYGVKSCLDLDIIQTQLCLFIDPIKKNARQLHLSWLFYVPDKPDCKNLIPPRAYDAGIPISSLLRINN